MQQRDVQGRGSPQGGGGREEQGRPDNYFVASARAGARLGGILRHVKEMHVVVINSQLVVARAGEEATGFEAISERLDSMSREASEQIRRVNQEAEVIARLAVRLYQAETAHVQFEEAQRQAAQAGEAHNLDAALATHNRRFEETRREAEEALTRFCRHLGGIEEFLASANHLAINARVEAAKTTEHRRQFKAVADHIQESVIDIREVVETVRKDVSDLQAIRGKTAA